MKKIIPIFVALVSIFNISYFNVALAQNGVQTIINEDFESDSPMQFLLNNAANGGCEIPFEDYYTGKAYKASSNSVCLSEQFTPLYPFSDYENYSEANNSHNLYAEVEFDATLSSYATSPVIYLSSDLAADHTSALAVKFDSNTKQIQLRCKEEKRTGSAGYANLMEYSTNKTYRIKIVMQLTDSTDVTCEKISKLYINGINVLSGPKYFASNSIGKIPYLNLFRIQNSTNMYIDNLSIIKYVSENGVSPLVEKGSLISALRKANSYIYEIETADDNNGFSNESIVQMKLYLQSAAVVYSASDSTQDNVDAAVNELNQIYEIAPESGEVITAVTYKLNQDFETDNQTPFTGVGTIVDSDEPTTLKFLKLNSSSSGFNLVSEKFEDSPITTADSDVYTEFDMKLGNLVSKKTQMRIKLYKDTTPDGTCISQIIFNGENGKIQLIHSTSKTDDLTTENWLSDDMWYRMRIVFHTSSAPQSRRPTMSIYVNGECIADKMYTQSYSDKASVYNTLSFIGMANSECYLCLDNLKIYSISDSEETVPLDFSKTVNIMRKVYSFFETAVPGINEGQYDEAEYNELKTKYEAAVALYSSADTQAKVDEIYTMLASAFSLIKPNGKMIQINSPQTTAEALTGNTVVGVSVDVTTNKAFTGNSDIYLLCLLMENSTDVPGGICRDSQVEKISLETNCEREADFTVDISGYTETEKENMFIAVMAVDSFTTLNTLTDEPYYLFGALQSDVESVEIKSDGVYQKRNCVNDTMIHSIIVKTKPDSSVNIIIFDKNDNPDTEYPEVKTFIQTKANTDGIAELGFYDGGYGEYQYAVRGSENLSEAGTLYYADKETIDDIFAKLNTQEGQNKFNVNSLYLGVEADAYTSASQKGISNIAVLGEVLALGTYNYTNVDKFADKYNSDIKALTKMKNAVNVDVIIENIEAVSNMLSNYAQYNLLSSSAKNTTAQYVYNNRGQITNNSTLDALIYAGIPKSPTIPPSSGGGGGGSSSGSTSGSYPRGENNYNLISNNVQPESNPPTSGIKTFDDVSESHWAYKAINAFSALGFVSGTGENEFSPDNNVRREDFVKMCVSVFNMYDENSSVEFDDVNTDDYFYTYVASAVKNGLIQGMDVNNFGTGNLLTRQDMAVIVHRLCNTVWENHSDEGVYIPFSDEMIFASYAKDSIIFLAKNGIINGRENNMFLPQDFCTRAEAVKMLYELYNRCK